MTAFFKDDNSRSFGLIIESVESANGERDMPKGSFVPLVGHRRYSSDGMRVRSRDFNREMQRRRTVRDFSDQPVNREIIENCLKVAGSAPSGANLQPWHFVVISDPALKQKIRIAAEEEEREFYRHRAPEEWLRALEPLGTDECKPFLERAPYLIAVFVQKYALLDDGQKVKHYYPTESVGLATGMLISAIHHAGLASLTHTPSPMAFLNDILGRPRKTERPFLLLVVGHPDEQATVPDIQRKTLEEVATFV